MAMGGRAMLAGCLAAVLLPAAPLGHTATRFPLAQPRVPLPTPGNVTVARFTLKAGAQSGGRTPRLAAVGPTRLPPKTFAVATVTRMAGPRVFRATVAIVRAPPESSPSAEPSAPLTLRVPTGFSLVGPTRLATNVLYANAMPPFGLVTGGTGSILAGDKPKLPLAQIVKDAQLLALDRSVPLADMGLLELPFVAVEIARPGATTLRVTISVAALNPVNAVELRFPSGMTIAKVTGPTGTDGLLLGNAVQLIASSGFFQQGVAYGFTLEAARAPARGEFVTVRASTHYFEGSLPFTERFAL